MRALQLEVCCYVYSYSVCSSECMVIHMHICLSECLCSQFFSYFDVLLDFSSSC